jgi:phosphocarrier protein HPr
MRGNGDSVAENTVRITNRLGLHARPSAEFVKLSSRFASSITVEKEGLEVNGKSIMGVMMLAAEFGSHLRIRADGIDATAAVQELSRLVESGFGESEIDYGTSSDGPEARS